LSDRPLVKLFFSSSRDLPQALFDTFFLPRRDVDDRIPSSNQHVELPTRFGNGVGSRCLGSILLRRDRLGFRRFRWNLGLSRPFGHCSIRRWLARSWSLAGLSRTVVSCAFTHDCDPLLEKSDASLVGSQRCKRAWMSSSVVVRSSFNTSSTSRDVPKTKIRPSGINSMSVTLVSPSQASCFGSLCSIRVAMVHLTKFKLCWRASRVARRDVAASSGRQRS
jgi:hypothetical protein